MSEPAEPGPLSQADLLDLILGLRTEIAGLRAENLALKDEIRRLKGCRRARPLSRAGWSGHPSGVLARGRVRSGAAPAGRSSPKNIVLALSPRRARGSWGGQALWCRI